MKEWRVFVSYDKYVIYSFSFKITWVVFLILYTRGILTSMFLYIDFGIINRVFIFYYTISIIGEENIYISLLHPYNTQEMNLILYKFKRKLCCWGSPPLAAPCALPWGSHYNASAYNIRFTLVLIKVQIWYYAYYS